MPCCSPRAGSSVRVKALLADASVASDGLSQSCDIEVPVSVSLLGRSVIIVDGVGIISLRGPQFTAACRSGMGTKTTSS